MPSIHTPAAARKLGLTALKLYAIGALLAAWWIWAVSLPQVAKLLDLAHGTSWRAVVGAEHRGLWFIGAAQAQDEPIRLELSKQYKALVRLEEKLAKTLAEQEDESSWPRWAITQEDLDRYLKTEKDQIKRQYISAFIEMHLHQADLLYKPEDIAAEIASLRMRENETVSQRLKRRADELSVFGASDPPGGTVMTNYALKLKAKRYNAGEKVLALQETHKNTDLWLYYFLKWAYQHKAVKAGRDTYAQIVGPTKADRAVATLDSEAISQIRYNDSKARLNSIPTVSTRVWRAVIHKEYIIAIFEHPESGVEQARYVRLNAPSWAYEAWRRCSSNNNCETPDPPEFAHKLEPPQQAVLPNVASPSVATKPAEVSEARQSIAPPAPLPQSAKAPRNTGDTQGGALFGVDVQKVRVWGLLGACTLLSLWVLMGGRFAAIRKPSFVPRRLLLLALPFVAVYAVTFLLAPASMQATLGPAALAFIPPLVFFVGPVYYKVSLEWLKESGFYRRWLVRGRGQEVARLGGVYAYLQRDISHYSSLNRAGIVRTRYSPMYVGATLGPLDYKLGGRDIGTMSEQHMITVAGSGAGKSRDAIFNNLAQYCGGVVAFDTKGELARFAYERRRAYAPVSIISPWDGMNESPGLNLPLAYWNPLDAIKPDSPGARDQIARMCEALIIPDGRDSGNSAHFREMAQMILRGYIAHVKTKFPPEQQHLGTVYDLFKRGAPNATTFDPEKVSQIVLDMADNPLCGSTAADAAAAFLSLEDREKSGVVSSITRAVDWMGSLVLKSYFANPSTVDLTHCKTRDASAFLVIPDMYRSTMKGFLRLFYQVAFDQLDEMNTRQPEGSGRRVLFLFDEFNSLGPFKAAVEAANMKRSSFIKCWFIVQNLGQFSALYDNPRDFLSNCDKQIFGMDRTDTETIDTIKKALGKYTDTRGETFDVKDVMSEGDITETLDGESGEQLFIPMLGAPMVLARVPYFARFSLWPVRVWGAFRRMMPRAI